MWVGGAKEFATATCRPSTPIPGYARNDNFAMPTLMQKIRLAMRGWNRRRDEKQREFLARNAGWGSGGQAISPVQPTGQAGLPVLHIDLDGLTVAYLDDSGQIAYYLDTETGDVIDARDGATMTGDRYRRVPSRSSQSEIEDRRAFVAALDPSSTRERLAACVGLAEAFRRTLASDRNAERAWYNFKNDRAIAAIEAWLKQIGLR